MYQEEEEEKKDEVSMVTWHEHDVNNLNQNPCPFIPATIKLNILSCDIYFQTLSRNVQNMYLISIFTYR